MIRRVVRVLAIAVLVLVAPAAMAGAVTHQMLNGTAWTEGQPDSTVKPTPAPTTPTSPSPSPSPTRTPSVGPDPYIGTCAIATRTAAVPAPCSTPGALRVVGTVRLDAGIDHPCQNMPFSLEVRRHGAYWLCLGTH